jgi:hypothetical protein
MAELETYVVAKDLCIDCNACYTTFPDMFKQVPWQGETKAEAYAPTEVGKFNPWDVVGCCPTDAISKIGEMPPKPEKKADELPPLEDMGPWEERWARVQGKKDSKWEIMKRYGMAAVVEEQKDRYIVKVEFPETTPTHILKYQMGLPDQMPDYKYELNFDESHKQITVNARMEDGHIKKLCGKINSFPDRFRRSFAFPYKVDLLRQIYRGKILTMELKKVPDATLQ